MWDEQLKHSRRRTLLLRHPQDSLLLSPRDANSTTSSLGAAKLDALCSLDESFPQEPLLPFSLGCMGKEKGTRGKERV